MTREGSVKSHLGPTIGCCGDNFEDHVGRDSGVGGKVFDGHAVLAE